MKLQGQFLIMLIFIFSVSAFGREVFWIELRPQFRYQDTETACASFNSSTSYLYFSTEKEGNQLIKAAFRKTPYLTFSNRVLELTEQEVSEIELMKDPQGKYIFSSFEVNPRILNWLFQTIDDIYGGCVPKSVLKTVTPELGRFEFSFGDGERPLSQTETLKFKGTDKLERPFEARLSFKQRSYNGEY